MQSDFVFHDGAYLRKEVLVTMAKNAGSFLLAEHYINSLLVHAILYKLPDIIDDVNEIREHYHVPPYPDLKAALASSTEKSKQENGLPSLEEQARDIYIHLNDKAQRMLLKDCLQLLIIEHPNMFQQKSHWMGVYHVVHDRLDGNLSKTDFYDFALDITPEDWPENLRIIPSTFSNYGRYVKYEDRQEAYYDMNDCPWQPLCDTLWDIIKNRLLTENRRKADGKLTEKLVV